MTHLADVGYRLPQMCELTGLTSRQLDYWARTDLLRPSISEAHGSGTRRRYSEADMERARVIKRLLDAGVSLQSVRRALPLVGEARADALRFLVVSDGMPRAVATGELERIIRETKVAVVIDLEAPP